MSLPLREAGFSVKKLSLGSHSLIFCVTLGSYLNSLGLYCFMCEVGLIHCTSLVEAPSNLRAFSHAVPSTWLTCAQSLKFSWNGFSSGTHPMSSPTTLSPSPIRQCAVVFYSTCLNYNWEHFALNLLCRIHAGSLYKGSKNQLIHPCLQLKHNHKLFVEWIKLVEINHRSDQEMEVSFIPLCIGLLEARVSLTFPQVSGWSWSRNIVDVQMDTINHLSILLLSSPACFSVSSLSVSYWLSGKFWNPCSTLYDAGFLFPERSWFQRAPWDRCKVRNEKQWLPWCF